MLNSRIENLTEDRTLTTREAGFFLGVSPNTVVNYAKKGILQGYRFTDQTYRFKFEELRKFRETHQLSFRHVYWDVEEERMPQRLMERLFGGANWKRICPDRKPESVIQALVIQVGMDCVRLAKHKAKKHRKAWRRQKASYRIRLKALEQEVSYLRLRLTETRPSQNSSA